jgi:hypothetical protein
MTHGNLPGKDKVKWIYERLQENEFIERNVIKLYDDYLQTFPENNPSRESYKKYVYAVYKQLKNGNIDTDILSENVRLAKNLQKSIDLNRIKNKGFREYSRIENALEEYSKAILEEIKKYDLSKFTIKHEVTDYKIGGLVNISDTHFNEYINIMGNFYDFTIAAKRLKKLAIQIKNYFKPFNIKCILLALTGDLLNSDRRLDEKLNEPLNRADASILSFFLLKQFILDLNQDFNITIASVSGNESRINDEFGYTDIVARDNYDFVIENFLKVQFMSCPGITFIDGDAKEKIVSIAGQNILLLHGETLGKDTQKSVQAKIGMYALKGIIINYAIYGHLHSCYVGDHSSRSSSLAGSNDYNEKALNLISRASQNIGIFFDNGSRDMIKVDLQHVDDIEGYEIIKDLEAYHSKSHMKASQGHKTIVEIII